MAGGTGALIREVFIKINTVFPFFFFANLAVKKTSLGFLSIQVGFTYHTLDLFLFLWLFVTLTCLW